MPQSLNLYQANKENLYRSACLLLSKCYKEQLHTAAITKDEQTARMLDDLLWTFSQQAFIPHGLSSIIEQNEQPIVIAFEQQISSSFDTVILLERFDTENINCHKLILMFTEQDKQTALDLKRNFKGQVNYYIQTPKGEWNKATI